MATTIEPKYGSNNQAVTCTLTSLAASATAGRGSAAIDNTTNLYLDALVFLKGIKTGAGTLGGSKAVYVWAYGTVDGGTTYTDTMTGLDANITRTDPPLVKLIGVVPIAVAATAYNAGPFSVAAAFGGILPDHWGIFVTNDTGLSLDASAAGSLLYQGVQGQSV